VQNYNLRFQNPKIPFLPFQVPTWLPVPDRSWLAGIYAEAEGSA
jgi:hypothetical protein